MKFYLGVTDNKWFKYLSHRTPEDVNFWQPGGNPRFKVIQPGAPFLFKLKIQLKRILFPKLLDDSKTRTSPIIG